MGLPIANAFLIFSLDDFPSPRVRGAGGYLRVMLAIGILF